MHILVLLIVFAVVAYFAWDRSNQLFAIQVHNGQAAVTRGQPPVRFMQTVRMVVGSPPVASATIRGVKGVDGVSLRCSGLSEGQQQRLRNAYRLMPQSAFSAGPNPVNEKNFWKVYNLSWLLRFLLRR